MKTRCFVWIMLAVFGGCGASLAQPWFPQTTHQRSRRTQDAHSFSTPADDLLAIDTDPDNCPLSGTHVHVIRVLIKPDSLLTKAQKPCDQCIRTLAADVGGNGVLGGYTKDDVQQAPKYPTTVDWRTPFDFDIKAGLKSPLGVDQPTAIQFVLLDSNFVFYYPYGSKPNDASQAAYVDFRDHDAFSCATTSPIKDNVNLKGVNASTLQFYITNLKANSTSVKPPGVNIGVIWEPPADNPPTTLPIAIDPHPTNNG